MAGAARSRQKTNTTGKIRQRRIVRHRQNTEGLKNGTRPAPVDASTHCKILEKEQAKVDQEL